MRTIYFKLIYLLLVGYNAAAQNNYNNHWFFGKGHNVIFSMGSVQNGGIPSATTPNSYQLLGPYEQFSVAVSHPQNGNLQFFVNIPKVISGNSFKQQPCFFDKNGAPFPNGTLNIVSYEMDNGLPLAIPHPNDTSLWYIITFLDKGMQYSIVDLTARNGLGDVRLTDKLIPLMNKNTVIGCKTTLIKGCNALYLYSKLSSSKGYVQYKIDKNGLDTVPHYQNIGNFPNNSYARTGNIVSTMKSSANGQMLAVATNNGVEIYDVAPCDGTLFNARVIDTTKSFGICFSPNNQLLYTTRAEYQTGYFQSSEIVQWDVSNPQNLNSIKGSEQVLLVNSAYDWPDWAGITSSYMGDIAQGKDGKLYILSNTVYADSVQQMPTPMPPTTIVPWAQTMHIIHQPNNLGMACMPERDAFYLDGRYIDRADYFLPQPIYAITNNSMDTAYGGVKNVTQCFGQPVTLQTPIGAACINWNTGSESISIHAQDTGWYWVRYNLACQVHLDSFYVNNIPLPQIPEYLIACPEQAVLDIRVAPNNRHTYHYDLRHTHRNDPRNIQTDSNWTWYKLLPGQYTLHLQSGSCDTTLSLFVDTFPRPQVAVMPQNNTLAYGDSLLLNASGAYLYNWFPTISLDTGTGAQVWARPQQTTQYEVIGINEYGCRDTAYTKITLDHSMEFFIPNAFSPNGDGLNDVFRLEGLSYQRLTEWGIYNRYGEQVFFTTNIHDSWDGTYRGQPCDAGVYYYYLQFFRTDGKLEERRGEVHLVR